MKSKINKATIVLIITMVVSTVVNYILVYNLVTMQGYTMQFISDVMLSQSLNGQSNHQHYEEDGHDNFHETPTEGQEE